MNSTRQTEQAQPFRSAGQDRVEFGGSSAKSPHLQALVGNVVPRKELQLIVDLAAQGKPFPNQAYLIKGLSGNPLVPTVTALSKDLAAWGIETFKVTGDSLALQTQTQGVHELFSRARASASLSPTRTAAIFIEDVEKAFPVRTTEPSERNRLLGAFLDEAGQLEGDNGTRLLLLGTTTNYNAIDNSVYKKFDKDLDIKLPADAKERREVLQNLIDQKGYILDPHADLQELAEGTDGNCERDLQGVMKIAYALAGTEPITTADLREARLRNKWDPPLAVTDDVGKFAITAGHEYCHVIPRLFFEMLGDPYTPRGIDLISFVPREGTAASVQLKAGVELPKTLEHFVGEIVSNYGGRIGEKVFGGGHLSDGPGSDISAATQLAQDAVLTNGMGKTLGAIQPSKTGVEAQYAGKAQADEDNILNTSQKLGSQIISFYQPFIQGMIDEAVANRGNPDKLITSGSECRQKMVAWQEANPQRQAELAELQAKVRQSVAELKPVDPT